MTNEIARPQRNFFLQYGEQATQRAIVGKLLKFSKGDFLAGQQGEQIEDGTKFIANMDQLFVGWVKWVDNRPAEQIMDRLVLGYQPPRRNELGDTDSDNWDVDDSGKPRDPWQYTNYLLLKAVDWEATEWDVGDESLFTFTTSSKGGISNIGILCKQYGTAGRQREGQYPIVAIGQDSYPHPIKSRGRIKYPTFKIVGWAPKSVFDNVEDAEADIPAIEAPAAQPGKPQQQSAKTLKGKPAPVRELIEELDPPHPKTATIAKGSQQRTKARF